MFRLQRYVSEKRDEIIAESLNGPSCEFYTGELFRNDTIEKLAPSKEQQQMDPNNRKRRFSAIQQIPASPEKRHCEKDRLQFPGDSQESDPSGESPQVIMEEDNNNHIGATESFCTQQLFTTSRSRRLCLTKLQKLKTSIL